MFSNHRFQAGRLSLLACFAIAVLGSLLLLAGGASAAAPPAGTPSGAAPAGQPAPNQRTGPTAPNACGNLWTTKAPYPGPVTSEAVVALNGSLYSFGGV